MKIKNVFAALVMTCSIAVSSTGFAQETKMVGGAEMYPTKNIVENAVNSKDHTTLVAAVQAADLVETLQSEGPFTVLAPTNAAFENLPDGTVASLLKPENKKALQGILTYHVIAGKNSAADIIADIKAGNGVAEWTTVNGQTLYGMLDGDMVKIKDQAGTVATVTIADVNQSNGVIHVIDTVLLPKM
ncbi:MAG: beta-Ig-H3/fasciclin [Leeuwenhoekiella sp.]|nr:MAG: beta-Ig-H3/fasciclin [Leeuwenhoekiella sp.]